jgi:hypothetical protein
MQGDHARRADYASAYGVPDYDGEPEPNAEDAKQPPSRYRHLRNFVCGWLQETLLQSVKTRASALLSPRGI